jgi:hypothetical protein
MGLSQPWTFALGEQLQGWDWAMDVFLNFHLPLLD